MAQIETPTSLKRVLATSLVLISLTTFTALIMGTGLSGINKDIKLLNSFLAEAENIQPNFEQSLLMYTDKTKDIIKYLLELRPDSEKELVRFISDIEEVAQDLSLQIDLESIAKSSAFADEEEEKDAIGYNISLYGNIQNLEDFLSQLEALEYFIGIEEISYKNTKYLVDEELEKENLKIRIKLYIKEN